MTTIQMLVATHKAAQIPADGFYHPIHVGRALNRVDLGITTDDLGENISQKNSSYCELTALYWAWKNLDADYIGLSHYRRYFSGGQDGPGGSKILSQSEARLIMNRSDILLSKPRNYYIETIDSHYRNGHHGEDLEVLEEVIASRTPEYLESYKTVFRGRKLALYNMFMMPKPLFDQYASWLFSVLEEVERSTNNSQRTAYQQRTFGYLGERLLNVWVQAHADQLSVEFRKVVNTEGEPIFRKGANLLRRKFGIRIVQ